MKQFTGWKAEKNDRQCTGHSGNSMWRQRRLQYIRRNRKRLYEELQTSDQSIPALMEQNGLTNYKTFLRMFHELYGTTPQKVRQSAR